MSSYPSTSFPRNRTYTPTHRVAEKASCQTFQAGFYPPHDPTRLPRQRIAARIDRLGTGRLGRASSGLRANAPDDGMSCEVVGKVLFLHDDTVGTWHRL